MRFTKHLALFFMLSLAVVGLASAAGVGTFSIEQTKSADVGQIGVSTLYMDNTWQPQADDVWVTVKWDGAALGYISTDWKVGNSVSATLNGTNSLFMQMADLTNKYPNGKVAIADINFKALTAGTSALTITVDHVRGHTGVDETNFTDMTASATANQGTFVVAPGTLTPTVVSDGQCHDGSDGCPDGQRHGQRHDGSDGQRHADRSDGCAHGRSGWEPQGDPEGGRHGLHRRVWS